MEMFTVYGDMAETHEGAPHLLVHVELNPDLFAELSDDETRSIMKTASEAIARMIDDIEIDRSKVE
jgi:hypothetical protein